MAYSKSGGTLRHSTGLMKIKHMAFVLDWRENLSIEQEKERQRKIEENAECVSLRDKIISIIGHDAYNVWWDAAPESGFLEAIRAKYAQLQTETPPRHCLTYNNRIAPGKFCPHCNIQLTVNEKPFKTTNQDAPHYERRLTCPNFFVNGCKHREAFTPEIQLSIDIAQAARDKEPAEF